MKLGGFANRIAHVDLTAGAVEYKGIPEEWARKYIGARGLEAGENVHRFAVDARDACAKRLERR